MRIESIQNYFDFEIGKLHPWANRIEYGFRLRWRRIYFYFVIASKNYELLERESLRIKGVSK